MALREKLRGIIGSIFQIGNDGPQIKDNSGVIEFRNLDDTGFAVVRAATPTADNDIVTKLYADTLEGTIRVLRQADTSTALPNNTSTRGYIVVTTAGSGAFIGDLLFDDGSNDSNPVQIISAVDGRVISVGVSLTGGTISFEADSLYHWDDTGGAWEKIGDIGSVTGAERVLRFTIDNTATQDSTFEIPSGYRINRVEVDVSTGYSGGATIEIGDTTTSDLIVAVGDVKEQKVSTYGIQQDTNWPNNSVVRVTVGGTPAAGAGSVKVWFSNVLS